MCTVLCRGLFVSISLLLLAAVGAGAEKVKNAASKRDARLAAEAEQLVSSALQAEVSGDAQERARLLEDAQRRFPDAPSVRWHSGQIWTGQKWISVDEAPKLAQKYKARQEYYRQREGKLSTQYNDLALADWCETRGLKDEARAHLLSVLDTDPDHERARQRLGYERVGNAWLTKEEYARARAEVRQMESAQAKFRPIVESLADRLDGNEATSAAAQRELLAINDAAAIPTLEDVLAERSGKAAMAFVKALAGMKEHVATAGLARRAVLSNWGNVNEAATTELKERPWDAFIPSMLAAMYLPIQVQSEIDTTPRGYVVLRQTLTREGQNVVETGEMNLGLTYLNYRLRGNRDEAAARELFSAVRNRQNTLSGELAQQNARSQWLNGRLVAVLASVTGENLGADPKKWWEWWNEHNDNMSDGKRQVYVGSRQETFDTYSYTLPPVTPRECFVAGTMVWTIEGAKAIETIRTGDLVLSQNEDSGELTYKPVVTTTYRPAVELVRLTTDSDTILCTRGHPFWVVGKGWVHARRLTRADRLHSVSGAVKINGVEKADEQPTYNLIVADFNSYFVGNGRLLVHDTAPKGPTETLVPGLAAEHAAK